MRLTASVYITGGLIALVMGIWMALDWRSNHGEWGDGAKFGGMEVLIGGYCLAFGIALWRDR